MANKSRKFFATATSAALVASAIVPVASAASFTDAEKIGSWAKEAVDFLADKEIITGNPDGSFNPQGNVNRAEAAKMFTKALDLSTEGTEDFSDVTEGQWFYEFVVAVSNAGIVNGKGEGLFAPKDNLTRAEAAKMIVEAYKLTGEADLSTFADANTVAGKWSEAYLSTAVANGVIKGKDGKLAANDSISRQEFAVMLKRAIDSESEVAEEVTVESVTAVNGTLTVKLAEKAETVDVKDFKVTQAINGGEAKAVTPSKAELAEDGLTVTLTVEEVAQADAEQSVVYTVNKVAAKAFVVEASALEVKSVEAINNAQILVTFNKEVDKTTAEEAANYEIVTQSTQLKLNDAEYTLQADKKSVIIDLAAENVAKNQDTAKLTVKNVKAATGEKIETTVKELSFFDVTLPTVVSVEQTGTKTLKVVFSEPIKTATSANFKINNGSYSAPTVVVGTGANRNEVTLTLTSELPTGSYTLSVEGVEDYAGFKSAKADKTFTIAADTTAPTVAIKEVKSDAKTIVVEFSKAIDSTTLVNNSNISFSHTYNGQNSVTGTAVTKVSDTIYEIKFDQTLPPGTANVFINYAANTADTNKVKDLYGNILVLPVTLTANVVADTTAPTVEKVEATKANEIEVTFSEDVVATDAEAISNYKLTNAKNEVVSIAKVSYSATDKKATIRTTANLDAGNYKLEVKNIKDKAVVANTLTTVIKDLVVADKVAPTVSSVVYDATSKKLIVKFSKDMAQTGLTTLTNYALTVDNATVAFPTGTTVAYKDSKTIEITLGKDVTGLDGANDKLQVSGSFTDNVGNAIGGLGVSTDIESAASIKPALAADTKVNFVDSETITFTLNTELKAIDASVSHYIQYDGADIKSFSYINDGGKAVVTVKVADAKKLTTDTSATGITGNLVIAEGALEGVYGGKNDEITVTGSTIVDKVAPAIKSATTADTSKNGQIDQLTVVFTEAVTADSVQASDFSISGGYSVASVVSVSGDTVVLKLNESGLADTDATPTVTLAGEVSDLLGNKASTSVAVTAADGAAPVLVKAVIKNKTDGTAGFGNDAEDELVLTFSEPVNTNFGSAVAPTATELDAIFAGVSFAGNSPVFSVNDLSSTASKTLTIKLDSGTLTKAIVVGDTITTKTTPTANDIEDVLDNTIAGEQVEVTVE